MPSLFRRSQKLNRRSSSSHKEEERREDDKKEEENYRKHSQHSSDYFHGRSRSLHDPNAERGAKSRGILTNGTIASPNHALKRTSTLPLNNRYLFPPCSPSTLRSPPSSPSYEPDRWAATIEEEDSERSSATPPVVEVKFRQRTHRVSATESNDESIIESASIDHDRRPLQTVRRMSSLLTRTHLSGIRVIQPRITDEFDRQSALWVEYRTNSLLKSMQKLGDMADQMQQHLSGEGPLGKSHDLFSLAEEFSEIAIVAYITVQDCGTQVPEGDDKHRLNECLVGMPALSRMTQNTVRERLRRYSPLIDVQNKVDAVIAAIRLYLNHLCTMTTVCMQVADEHGIVVAAPTEHFPLPTACAFTSEEVEALIVPPVEVVEEEVASPNRLSTVSTTSHIPMHRRRSNIYQRQLSTRRGLTSDRASTASSPLSPSPTGRVQTGFLFGRAMVNRPTSLNANL